MDDDWLTGIADEIDQEEVCIPRARELVDVLLTDTLPHVRFVETRRDSAGREYVVLDVDPEVPQRPVNDIRIPERIAVRFDPEDILQPNPLALRSDFPEVSHENLRAAGEPHSLCLFEEAYSEQKLTWTAAKFLRQLHLWLSKTARGELHEPDQPLEQFLVGPYSEVILPSVLYETEVGPYERRLLITAVPRTRDERLTLIAVEDDNENAPEGAVPFVGIVVDAEPRTHGVLRLRPLTLLELHDFLIEAGVNLLELLRDRLRGWLDEVPDLLERYLLIVVRLPKRRSDAGSVESVEMWAFMPNGKLREFGEALGLLATEGEFTGLLLGSTEVERRGADVRLDLLNPTSALTRNRAARLNGVSDQLDRSILAVGAGALGSQVIMNLARSGYGCWTIVDEDVLLPHNVARHSLDGFAVGREKAGSLAYCIDSITEDTPMARGIMADVLEAEGSTDLEEAYVTSDVVLDMSASIAVARHLTLNVGSDSRRISLFTNPDGTDLVLLAEDPDRTHRLDYLEMQYYRELLHRAELSQHLRPGGESLRYAHTCRDATMTLSQDALSAFAGVGSRAVRRSINEEAARISIWQSDEDLAVSKLEVQPTRWTSVEASDWTLVHDDWLVRRLAELRSAKLPKETGGVLIGSYDTQNKLIYVVDTVPSPPDSEEWPTLYIRGSQGLKGSVEEINELTAGWLVYVGEWHSHPDGVACSPSSDDEKVFRWLADYLLSERLPPLMAIACEGGVVQWCFVGMEA